MTTHGWTTRLATVVLALALTTSAHAMHVETCDGPYAFQSLDVTTLPPGHAKKIRADLDRALEHPGTLRQLLKRYPAEVVAAWRLNPETARQALVAPQDRARILAAAGEGYSACIPQEVVMGGTPVSAVEQRPDRPYYVDALQRLDGRYYRLNAHPQSYRQDRPVTVRGWQMGHDLLVETLEQDGEVVADEPWNDYLRPNTPTTGETRVTLVGFTFPGSVDTPTVAGLTAMAAQAAVRARENSDPDGPGPLPPSWQPVYTVWPEIVDVGDPTTLTDFVKVAQRLQALTGWTATRDGDAFHIVGDGANLPSRWNYGGVNFLNSVSFQGSTKLVNLGASITRAGSGTLNHELQHGLAGHHEEGIGGCMYTIPGLQGLVSPCYLQPYGFRVGTLGSSSVDAANSPGLQVDVWGWTPTSMVREITGPGRYTIRGYRQDGALPSVLRLNRSSRPSDYLYIAAWKDAPRTPTGARSGAFFQTRSGNRWYEPLTVNCKAASTGHLDVACPLGTVLVEPITGYRLTVESETPTSLTVAVEAGIPPTTTTFPPTTTSTLAPSTIVMALSTTPYPMVAGSPAEIRAWARRADETNLRIPEAVEWIAPATGTTNPLRWTPPTAGWVWVEWRVRLDGIWSTVKRMQMLVDPGTTTTSTVPPTTTSSSASTSSTSTTTTSSTVPGGYTAARIVGPRSLPAGTPGTWTCEAQTAAGAWVAPACCWWQYTPDPAAPDEAAPTCQPCTVTIGTSAPLSSGLIDAAAHHAGANQWTFAPTLRLTVGTSTTSTTPPTTTSTSSTTSTTGTLPPTTSTSTSSSTSTSRPPTTTSTSSTTSSTVGTTTSTSSSTSSTRPPTTTTTTLPPTCAEEGQLCNRHTDCRQSPGCEEYQCTRKWWHIWDRRKRCAPRGRPRGGRTRG